jgi:hypothetical protein
LKRTSVSPARWFHFGQLSPLARLWTASQARVPDMACLPVRGLSQPGAIGDVCAVVAWRQGRCSPDSFEAAHGGERVAAEFERLYKAWHRECRRISSHTHDYVLPSYLRIVDLGRLALPFLEKKLSEDRNGDLMLAEAVMEICREAPESRYRRKAHRPLTEMLAAAWSSAVMTSDTWK